VIWWVAAALLCVVALRHDPAAQQSALRRGLWTGGALLCAAVAAVITITVLRPSARIGWIQPWNGGVREWLGVALVCIVGIAIYAVMEMGYIDMHPRVARFWVLYSFVVFALWAVLSYSNEERVHTERNSDENKVRQKETEIHTHET